MSSNAKVHPTEPPPMYQGETSANVQPPPPPAQATYQPPPQQGQANYQPPTQQPPPNYHPQMQQPVGYYGGQQTTVVIAGQPTGFGRSGFGPSPQTIKCPHCSVNVTTSTSKQCGGMVWMVAGIICLIGFSFPLIWLGCCLIPFCIPSLYDTTHNCPSCQKEVGQFKAGGSI